MEMMHEHFCERKAQNIRERSEQNVSVKSQGAKQLGHTYRFEVQNLGEQSH